MKLLKLVLDNFISHKNSEIDLSTGHNLINGESGAGKSTIFEGILFALYNKCRTKSKFLVHKDEEKTCVTLTFEKEYSGKTVVYTIVRSVTSSGKSNVNLFEEDRDISQGSVKTTDEYIINLIGVSYDVFVNTVCFLQKNNRGFTTASSTDRLNILSELLRLSEYENLLKNVKEVKKSKEVEKIEIDTELKYLLSDFAQFMEGFAGVTDIETILEGLGENFANQIDILIIDLEKSMTLLNAVIETLDDLENNQRGSDELLKKKEEAKMMKSKIFQELQNLKGEISSTELEKESQQKLKDNFHKVKEAKEKIKDLDFKIGEEEKKEQENSSILNQINKII